MGRPRRNKSSPPSLPSSISGTEPNPSEKSSPDSTPFPLPPASMQETTPSSRVQDTQLSSFQTAYLIPPFEHYRVPESNRTDSAGSIRTRPSARRAASFDASERLSSLALDGRRAETSGERQRGRPLLAGSSHSFHSLPMPNVTTPSERCASKVFSPFIHPS